MPTPNCQQTGYTPISHPNDCTFPVIRSMVKYTSFNVQTQTWGVVQNISNGVGTTRFPQITGNLLGSTFYVLWQDNMPASYSPTSAANPAALVGVLGSVYENCDQTNLTAAQVTGTNGAEGLSCDVLLMRIIRLEIDENTGATAFMA